MRNVLVPLIFKCLAPLPLTVSRGVGKAIGSLLWRLKGRDYRITLKNISNCFPQLNEQQRQQLTRDSLIETVKTTAEVAAIWRNSWAWLEDKIIEREGEDLLRAELAKGQGLLVLAPHLGNWEVVAPYLASIAPLTAMYQPFPIPKMDQMILCGRSKCNISMAPTNRKGVAMLLKALQQGNIVGILPDQLPKKDAGSEFAPFFGQQVLTMTLVHALLSRTQSRVVCVFAKRVDDGFKMIVLPAHEAIYSPDLVESLAGLNASVEGCVHLAPAQYQWEYNRFRCPRSHTEAREQRAQAAQQRCKIPDCDEPQHPQK